MRTEIILWIVAAAGAYAYPAAAFSLNRPHTPTPTPLPLPSVDIAANDLPFTNTVSSSLQRRELMKRATFALTSLVVGITITAPHKSNAYDNAVPEYAQYIDKPKRRGNPPKDLGISPRTTEGKENLDEVTKPGLRTCDGNPNCFSTTGDYELADRTQKGVDFLIAPWIPSKDDPAPLKTLSGVIQGYYKAGQGGIDGGGFGVIKETDSYLYLRFESLKKGFIDDVEFATTSTKETPGILVRSASRIGITDFGVNAIRLNSIAAVLVKEKGWSIAEITPVTHRDYYEAAIDAREATFDSSRKDMKGAEEVKAQIEATTDASAR